MSEDTFYTKLPSFDKFADFTKEANFVALPEDWCVVVSDIEGSTKAIENFGLKLRIGLVHVSELYQAGAKLEIRRYELIAGRHLAVFRGGGLTLAEKWIKQSASKHLIAPFTSDRANIDGLSCRWNAIPNIRGTIVSLIIQKCDEAPDAVYQNILKHLNEICDGDLDSANPVNIPRVSYQSIRNATPSVCERMWTIENPTMFYVWYWTSAYPSATPFKRIWR